MNARADSGSGPLRWNIITGEYPPHSGGVGDYTRLVARGLAEAGDEVRVWAPEAPGPSPLDPGVQLRRLPGHFGSRALALLHRELTRERQPYRLLVQYVPHMYGWNAMNVLFSGWLGWGCPVRPWVMFHEVAFPVAWRQPLRHNFLGLVHRWMARTVVGSAERIFLSVPWWMRLLGRRATAGQKAAWLPVPSNVPTEADAPAVAGVRARYAPAGGARLIGHFGTFPPLVAEPLRGALGALLARNSRRAALLIGPGGKAVAEQLGSGAAGLAGRVFATGPLPADGVAAHLAACDLLVQPFPDGASSRRGSLMAGIGLGLPVVTTHGPATEPVWAAEGLVASVPAGDAAALKDTAEGLLADGPARADLARRARAGYDAHFSLRHTLAALRQT
jgi:glycosyltransferase involved in cell wall biosynthesis